MKDYTQLSQSYAISIESTLRRIFKCKYGEKLGNQITADQIRKHPFLSMTQGLAYLYALYPNKQKIIDIFINDFSFYEEFSIDAILKFTNKSNTIGIVTYELRKNNGKEELDYIIDEFDKIINEILAE